MILIIQIRTAHLYDQLSFDEDTDIFQLEKDNLSNKLCWKN